MIILAPQEDSFLSLSFHATVVVTLLLYNLVIALLKCQLSKNLILFYRGLKAICHYLMRADGSSAFTNTGPSLLG